MATIDRRRGKWRVQIRRDGHAFSKTFRLRMDAEAFAREAERAIDQGLDPKRRRPPKGETLGTLIDLHIADLHQVGKPIRRSKRHVLARLTRDMGDVPLAHLTRERLIAFGRDRAKEGAGPSTLSIDLSFIGTVLSHAAAVHGMIVDTESVRLARIALSKLGLVGLARERDRRPTQEEIDQLCAYFDAKARQAIPMARLIRFAIATAMRADEICRIRWAQLDPRTRTIVVSDRKDPRKKEGNHQRVPLLPVTGYDGLGLLEEQRALGLTDPRCFPYNSKSVSNVFTRACRVLAIEDLHFHDLRHEATSRLFEAGLTIEQVPLVTGHKDWKLLKRYTQLKPERLFEIVENARWRST